MVDTCNALKAGKAGAITTINPLSAQLAGLNAATCVVTPGFSRRLRTFSRFLRVKRRRIIISLMSPPKLPLNNGIFKGDYAINTHHHLSGIVFISKSAA